MGYLLGARSRPFDGTDHAVGLVTSAFGDGRSKPRDAGRAVRSLPRDPDGRLWP